MTINQRSILPIIQGNHKENLDSGLICTLFISTRGQLADLLIKVLNSVVFHTIIGKLGMENIRSPS